MRGGGWLDGLALGVGWRRIRGGCWSVRNSERMGSGASKPPAGSTTTSKGKPGSATSGVNLPVSTAATTGVAVLIIDPQNSFHGGGSLAVPGADEV